VEGLSFFLSEQIVMSLDKTATRHYSVVSRWVFRMLDYTGKVLAATLAH
jgi:hypothetical protein